MSRLLASLAFYPSLAWGMLISRVLRVWNVWDEIDDGVLLGGLPWKRDAAGLHEAGVRAVVNTCEEYDGPVQEYARLGIEQLHLPTVDFLPPSFEAINEAVDFIDRHRGAGHAVYVHCKAGRGRSATIVLCWLMRERGMTPDEAQQFMQQRRRQVSRRLAQREVVQQFWQAECHARSSG
ncbi:MAG: dual specificity protein phosphatase family protein [Planctomycetes bacterium]|nr:dual specificity protein phosphatase family protein [Planctomycetota bacterium]